MPSECVSARTPQRLLLELHGGASLFTLTSDLSLIPSSVYRLCPETKSSSSSTCSCVAQQRCAFPLRGVSVGGTWDFEL